MNIDDLTIGQLKQIQSMGSNKSASFFEVGKNYLIRTVTMIQTGKLVAFNDQELLLSDACWVADTGRFNEALKDINVFKEVEPFQYDVVVGRGAIVDATQIDELPTQVK